MNAIDIELDIPENELRNLFQIKKILSNDEKIQTTILFLTAFYLS